MTKAEFLAALRSRLAGLPGEDTETFLDYYGEIIDDRIEDGLSEAEAVEALGSIDAVVGGILEETPLPRLVRAKVAPRRALRIWEIVLLVLGAPVWLSLLIAAAAVLLAVYAVIWAVVAVLFAVFVSFAAGVPAGLAGAVLAAVAGGAAPALLSAAAGLVCAGLAILMFHAACLSVRGAVWLGRIILRGIKIGLVGKEAAA